jgi:hypothetical protein
MIDRISEEKSVDESPIHGRWNDAYSWQGFLQALYAKGIWIYV